MGFAIPIEDALYYANALEKGVTIKRPYVGIGILDVNETYYIWSNGINIDNSIKTGVIVSEIVNDSPASAGGLQKGDVIYEVSGEKVDTKAQFRYELYKHQPGDTIEIKYYRGKDKKTTKITLTTSK